MTTNELVSIITMLCLKFRNESDKLSCFDTYVNCAIVESGKILNHTKFVDKCLKQEK